MENFHHKSIISIGRPRLITAITYWMALFPGQILCHATYLLCIFAYFWTFWYCV